MGFTDPDTVHNPSTGTIAPASWGDIVNANLNYLANPARAKGYRSSTQAITTATSTALEWNAESWDTDSMHSTGTNPDRFTAVTAGRYYVMCRAVFATNATGTRDLKLFLNGDTGTLLDRHSKDDPSGGDYTRLLVLGEVELGVGDYVNAYVYQSSGGNLNIIGASPGSSDANEHSWMTVRWMGTI